MLPIKYKMAESGQYREKHLSGPLDVIFTSFYAATFQEDFGPFRKGETVACLTAYFSTGELEEDLPAMNKVEGRKCHFMAVCTEGLQ